MENETHIRAYASGDQGAVLAIWKECGLVVSQNDPAKDILRKLRVNPEWFFVAERRGGIVGTCMAGYEGHRGWVNYLAVHPSEQGKGIARQLIEEAERMLRAAGCPKINLQVRAENGGAIDFYRKLGFTEDKVVSLGKRLEEDSV